MQTPGGAAGQFAAHQALLVALRAQQAGAAGGGAAVACAPATGSSAKEASSFGPAVDHDVNDSIEDVNDFLVTASAAAAVNSLELSSAEIADKEISEIPYLRLQRH